MNKWFTEKAQMIQIHEEMLSLTHRCSLNPRRMSKVKKIDNVLW